MCLSAYLPVSLHVNLCVCLPAFRLCHEIDPLFPPPEYGGIYLDTDQVVLKPVDVFRLTGFSVFEEGGTGYISNAVMFARPDHVFTRRWLRHWQSYDGRSWASHSIEYITQVADQENEQVFGAFF